MSRDTESPGAEFKVAVAGPIVTLDRRRAVRRASARPLAGWDTFVDAATLRHTAGVTPALVLLGWLASINAFVFVFNLIPAFPLDGGRIARAIAWRVTGDRLRATKIAAGLGQAFSVLLIGGGLFQIIAFQTLWPLWYVVLGLFLGQAARGAVVQTAFAERLGEVRVEDIMDREPVATPAELDAERALDEFFHRYRWSWFPVVDAADHFVGIIRQERVDGARALGRRPAHRGRADGRRRRRLAGRLGGLARVAARLGAAAPPRRADGGRPRRRPARRRHDRAGPARAAVGGRAAGAQHLGA